MNGSVAWVRADPTPEVLPMPPQSTCSIENCSTRTYARGWCEVHYRRWRRHGDPVVTLTPTLGVPVADRLWRFVDVRGADDCWPWVGGNIAKGYGQLRLRGRGTVRAHRFAYELAHGPIPEGLFVLHRCDNPPCVNPAHLFLGTQQDNMDDMIAKGRAVHPTRRSI